MSYNITYGSELVVTRKCQQVHEESDTCIFPKPDHCGCPDQLDQFKTSFKLQDGCSCKFVSHCNEDFCNSGTQIGFVFDSILLFVGIHFLNNF